MLLVLNRQKRYTLLFVRMALSSPPPVVLVDGANLGLLVHPKQGVEAQVPHPCQSTKTSHSYNQPTRKMNRKYLIYLF